MPNAKKKNLKTQEKTAQQQNEILNLSSRRKFIKFLTVKNRLRHVRSTNDMSTGEHATKPPTNFSRHETMAKS